MNQNQNQSAPVAPSPGGDEITSSPTAATGPQDQQQVERCQSPARICRNHQRRPSAATCNTGRKFAISGFVCLILAVFLLAPPPGHQLAEGAKIKKAVKSIAKGLIFQSLSTKKNFLPLPVPIPVPIEINEDPIYLKGKPKYINIYKQPKPTPQPVVKPTTVYHMPIYSPTYEYMSMDPMNSMYGAQMMYGPYSSGPSSYKSSVNTDSDSTSSVASASHGGTSYGGLNFNDYDDESGSYYMKKSAARRRKLMPGEYASNVNMHRIDMANQGGGQVPQEGFFHGREAAFHQREMRGHQAYGLAPEEAMDNEAELQPNDDESYDHEGDNTSWAMSHGATLHRGTRVKRQVYYESGYDGNTNCEGFPLEINVRSRIKLDRIFPIHGKSQIKKCVKIKKTLLPPQEEHY